MDLSQYAELFLAESREHLSACNQLLLEWERRPSSPEPVSGIFRAVHTMKGMAATMGYGRVADLAHRMENLLDQLRRSGKPPTDDTLQMLFRATDALEKAVELAVKGHERDLDLSAVSAELDRALAKPLTAASSTVSSTADSPTAASSTAPAPSGSGRLVQVTIRPEAPLKGGRAMLLLRKAQSLGTVQRVQPPPTAFESDDFDGNVAFELYSSAASPEIEVALHAVGDVERVSIGGGEAGRVDDAVGGAGGG
ncbi:MAG TPA: Hpt domain-containing protein, partial [Gemmatimonadales bacterium]|nr:Hpt domain-containing protein [Gemmatimonadales bacterium]